MTVALTCIGLGCFGFYLVGASDLSKMDYKAELQNRIEEVMNDD